MDYFRNTKRMISDSFREQALDATLLHQVYGDALEYMEMVRERSVFPEAETLA